MSLYKLEVEKAIAKIKKVKAKTVCIQLPEGLKPQANKIVDQIQAETNAKVLIWLGSNYGACDLPLGLSRMGIDLLISWGHNLFHKQEGGW